MGAVVVVVAVAVTSVAMMMVRLCMTRMGWSVDPMLAAIAVAVAATAFILRSAAVGTQEGGIEVIGLDGRR